MDLHTVDSELLLLVCYMYTEKYVRPQYVLGLLLALLAIAVLFTNVSGLLNKMAGWVLDFISVHCNGRIFGIMVNPTTMPIPAHSFKGNGAI
jgi:hypothetical protein